jgi:hypothetical protein
VSPFRSGVLWSGEEKPAALASPRAAMLGNTPGYIIQNIQVIQYKHTKPFLKQLRYRAAVLKAVQRVSQFRTINTTYTKHTHVFLVSLGRLSGSSETIRTRAQRTVDLGW